MTASGVAIARPTSVSVWDRRDPRCIYEAVLLRMTINQEKLTHIELIPFSIDEGGQLYCVPRLASTARAKEIIDLLQKL